MAIQTERVRAILFDIDGTLSDTDDQMVERVMGMINPFLRSQVKRRAAARWFVMALESPGNFLYNLVDRFDLDSFLLRILNHLTKKRQRKARKYWLIPGVGEMLPKLNKRYPLGIVSARDEVSAIMFLKQFSLEDIFKVVVTSQTCRYTKPFPDPMLFAAKKLSIAPENCLMVGDTTVDIKAAKLAGMQVVGVLCGFGRDKELRRAGADEILNSTAELHNLFKRS